MGEITIRQRQVIPGDEELVARCLASPASLDGAESPRLQLHAATELRVLASPPGNQLEALRGNRKGQHSIRINDQWRICFVWRDSHCYDVEIVDYH